MIDARLFDKLVSTNSPKFDEPNVDPADQEYLARRIRNNPKPFGGIQARTAPQFPV